MRTYIKAIGISSLMLPKHIGFIPDGNRRFAKKCSWRPWKGHSKGAEKIKELINWCIELNILELTIYSFSTENFKRPDKEKEELFSLFRKAFHELKDEKAKIKIGFIGSLHLFPQDMQNMMQQITEKTKDINGLKVNFALGYGGKQEIVNATKSIASKIKSGELSLEEINETLLHEHMYINNDIDLIIRTGDQIRNSNFLLYQGAYAEYVFMEKLFPEIEKEDFLDALNDFKERKRNFGV